MIKTILCLTALLPLAACTPKTPADTPAQPGGNTSVSPAGGISFMKPLANLTSAAQADFYAGKALAEQPWVKAPATTAARDGLGPLYNARSCLACHANGGRGALPENPAENLFSAVLRLSVAGDDLQAGVVPEPHYGSQIQTQSISLEHQLGLPADPTGIAAEARVHIHWQSHTFTYPDGSSLELRKPQFELQQLAYGALAADTRFSLRNSPPLAGMGLLEAIPEADILANEDPEDKNGDGLSGRANLVWDQDVQMLRLGRYGLKANMASLEHVVAAAFLNDIGISNPLFAQQNCSPVQTTCAKAPSGNSADGFELPRDLLKLVTDFTRHLAVMQYRQPPNAQGHLLFYQLNCQGCHHPEYVTADNKGANSRQRIYPYSDWLLHDMGPELADGRSDFLATGSEWRTAPLWGVGLSEAVNGHRYLLHDGRAANVEQAILWHGGEAAASRQAFTQLDKHMRAALIDFVESL